MADPTPTPAPAPAAKPGFWAWLRGASPFLALALFVVYMEWTRARTAAPAPPPDRIVAAAKAWRAAEGKAYLDVAAQVRAGTVKPLDAGAAVKAALTPTATELTAAVNAAMSGATGPAAAIPLETAGKALGGK